MGLGDQIHRATADVLDRMAGYLTIGWTTGALARDASGRACGPTDNDAVCWCLNGAALAAAAQIEPADVFIGSAVERAGFALVAIGTHLGEATTTWNDNDAIGPEHVRGVVLDVVRRWSQSDAILVSAVHCAAMDGTTATIAGVDDELPF